MRAQFNKTGGSGYHLRLHPNIMPAVTIDVPSGTGTLLQSGRGVVFADVKYNWWGSRIQNLMQSANPTHFPLYLTDNVLLYTGSDVTNCCVIGFHGAGETVGHGTGSVNGNANQAVQTFAWASWVQPGIYARPDGGTDWALQDIHALSHEIAEIRGVAKPLLDSKCRTCYDVTAPVTGPVTDPESTIILMNRVKSGRSRVNIRRVAQEAGVSPQTVSRVLNNRPDVAAETRHRVQEIIAQLGYRPSAIARGLSSQRTRTLGLITADFSDYFFTQVIAGAEHEARQYGYRFMLSSTERNPEDEPEYIRLLTEYHVDGILFARPSTEPDNRYVVKLLRDGVPVLTTAYHIPGEDLTVIDVDNIDGAQQAIRYLLEHGHRQIAMITGPTSWKSVLDRTQGYSTALESAGISVEPELIGEADWSFRGGYQAMQKLLARARPFSALFAQNDQMAIGALRALREAGRRVPQDVSVVGYDDIPMAEYCEPPLTTIRQPMREVGAVATRLLIQAIEKPSTSQGEILLKTELIVRESCA